MHVLLLIWPQGDAPDFDRSAWTSVKFTLGLDFPNLPYLIDRETGVGITQTLAVLKYIAKVSGSETLANGAPELSAYADMLANVAMDLRNGLVRFFGCVWHVPTCVCDV